MSLKDLEIVGSTFCSLIISQETLNVRIISFILARTCNSLNRYSESSGQIHLSIFTLLFLDTFRSMSIVVRCRKTDLKMHRYSLLNNTLLVSLKKTNHFILGQIFAMKHLPTWRPGQICLVKLSKRRSG